MMKIKNARLIIPITGLGLLLFAGSCAPAYIPNMINTPMLSNKGEGQVSFNFGLAGFDPQVSYAITDHLGVMLNGSFANRTSDSTDNFHQHAFIEAGTGYFQKIGTSGRFETYGGAGFGKLKAEFDNELWITRSDVNCMRFFVQPAVGASTDIFDGSLAARFVVLNLKQESKNSTGLFIEPAITAEVGYKYAKAIFQFGLAIPLNQSKIEYNYQPFIFSVGMQATLGRIYD